MEAAQLTADVVAMGIREGRLHVLLIERDWPPFQGLLAFPGGHVDAGEDVEAAAHRDLAEETGVGVDRLELVGVYSAPGRDPRGRYATWAYLAVLDDLPCPTAGDDARAARWCPVDEVLQHPEWLAFDHHLILRAAVQQEQGNRTFLAKSRGE
jgi:8-oxo-dGTP diphosphatase